MSIVSVARAILMSPLWILTYTTNKILGPDYDDDEQKKITPPIEIDLENGLSVDILSSSASAAAQSVPIQIKEQHAKLNRFN